MPTSGPDKSGHIKRVGILTGLFCVVNDQFGTEKSGHNKRVGILTSGHINRSLLYHVNVELTLLSGPQEADLLP